MSEPQTEIISKLQAMEMLSTQLRKKNIPTDLLLKMLAVYAKLANWDQQEIPSTPIDELVSQIEAKRKSQNV